MSVLMKLTADELIDEACYGLGPSPELVSEIRRRLERLEKCEAALRYLINCQNKPKCKSCQEMARAALEGK